MLSRDDKTFKILLNGREETVSVDRIHPRGYDSFNVCRKRERDTIVDSIEIRPAGLSFCFSFRIKLRNESTLLNYFVDPRW